MKHYQLLATISIDGCLLNLTPESHWVLMAALYSLSDYMDLAGSMTGEKDTINFDECYPLIEARKGLYSFEAIDQVLLFHRHFLRILPRLHFKVFLHCHLHCHHRIAATFHSSHNH